MVTDRQMDGKRTDWCLYGRRLLTCIPAGLKANSGALPTGGGFVSAGLLSNNTGSATLHVWLACFGGGAPTQCRGVMPVSLYPTGPVLNELHVDCLSRFTSLRDSLSPYSAFYRIV